MSERLIWIINNGNRDQEILVEDWKRFVNFVPGRPQQVPENKALQLVTQFHNMKVCEHPELYFGNKPQKLLIQRDGGIGDLLLLEPVIRQMKQEGNKTVSVLSMNPAVFENNPYVDNNIKADTKETIPVKPSEYDFWDDYRNYSESHNDRAKKHRTDIYASKKDIKLSDKNPRLYFKRDEKNKIFIKEPGKTYIGLAMDGSHSYRRYDRGVDIIKHILAADSSAIVVIFGSWDFVKISETDRVIDLQKKTSVREMILAVRDLDYLISVDTGIMHVGMTLHVPTLGMFSICSPEYRITYYDGPKRFLSKKDLSCIGCGDWHMMVCKHGDKNAHPEFVPPCMDWEPDLIYKTLMEMPKSDDRRVFFSDEKIEVKQISVNILPEKKLTMPIIVLNEEQNLPRFIDLVIKNPYIGRVIAIDGGSTDKTVELLKDAGAEVYIHPYIKTYHDQQAMQRNISCSYVADGTPIIILDNDECFSDELSNFLPLLAEQKGFHFGMIYRRTFNKFEDINDISKAIKDWPDPQPRYYIWNKKFKFVGGPHHQTVNTPAPTTIAQPILHFENQNGKRAEIDAQWNDMKSRLP